MWNRIGVARLATLIGSVAGFGVGAAFLLASGGAPVASGAARVPSHALLGHGQMVQRPASRHVKLELVRHFPRLRALLADARVRPHALTASTIPPSVDQSLLVQFYRTFDPTASVAESDLAALSIEQVSAGTAGTFWVASGGGRVCVNIVATATSASGAQIQGSPGVCETDEDVLQDGLVGTNTLDGEYTVYGLVPSGNSSVSVSLPAGGSSNIPVSDGAVFANFSAPPHELTFTNADAQSVNLP